MKIISPFHDYYDTALGYGRDPKLVYRRTTRVEPRPAISLPRSFGLMPVTPYQARPRLEAALWFVAFCGRSYPVLALTTADGDERTILRYCWFEGDVEKALQDFPDALRVFDGRRRSRLYRPLTRARVAELLSKQLTARAVHELHRTVRSPVVLLRTFSPPYRWSRQAEAVVDPSLKAMEFFRLVDPFAAFQEISLYLGGVLGMPEQTHRPIPDDALRDMKGFDEGSFKTVSPGDRKRRRWSKRST